MLKKILYFSFVAFLLVFISCKKDTAEKTATNSMIGEWKFINLKHDSRSWVERRFSSITEVDATLTFTKYTSMNNTGTIRFDGTNMILTNFGYSVDTTLMVYFYTNGQLEDSVDYPFSTTVLPASSQSKYKMIGADSIYMEGGTIVNTTLGNTTTRPTGARLQFSGNRLLMKASNKVSETKNLGDGVTQSTELDGTSVFLLEKL